MNQLISRIAALGACKDALAFLAKCQTPEEALERASNTWLCWLLLKLGGPTLAAYEAVSKPAATEYEAARRIAWAVYERNKLWELYGATMDPVFKKYHAVMQPLLKKTIRDWYESNPNPNPAGANNNA